MPKMKTNKSAAKRFKRSGGGDAVVHARANRRHLLTKKAPKRMRHLRGAAAIRGGDSKRAMRMTPYA